MFLADKILPNNDSLYFEKKMTNKETINVIGDDIYIF